MPRVRKSPMITAGTDHSGMLPCCVNPLSSSGFIIAASPGSVAAPIAAPIAASTKASLVPAK